MTRPSKWDFKTWLIVAGFFGVSSFAGFLSKAQQIFGWGAGPSIEQAQRRGLDSLRIWRQMDRDADLLWKSDIKARVDSIVDRQKYVIRILLKIPAAKAAAKEIEREKREQDYLLGRPGIATHKTTLLAIKGRRNP